MSDPVLVVGAGPSGLAAALALARNGVPVRVVEKLPAFHTASRGSGIHSRTMEIFHLLGIVEDVRRIAIPLFPMQSYKLPGGTEVDKTWRMFEPGVATPDRPIVSGEKMAISQYLLEGIFRDHLSKYGIQVELATELVSIEQDHEGVTATLKKYNDTGEGIEKARAAYVIGADGAKGVSRKLIGATFEGQTRDLDGQVWADVKIEGLPSDHWHTWAEPAHFTIAMRPTHHEGSFHVGIVGVNFDPAELTDPEKFVKFIHERTGRHDLKITNFTSMSYWKPKMRMANKFSCGRVFIAGDVAHVHAPTGGQGLNTSVQDSLNLAWKIALAYKGVAQPDLLSSYDAERIPVVAVMLSTTTNLYGKGTRREEAEKLVAEPDKKDQSTWLRWRNSALSQLDINYRWSPIIFDARGNSGCSDAELKTKAYEGYPDEDVHAGDRAPGAPGLVDASGTKTSLHDIFKPHLHTILIFSSDATDVEHKVDDVVKVISQLLSQDTYQIAILARSGRIPKVRHGVAAYHDEEEYAFKAYGVADGKLTVAVVRPDMYVGAYVYDTEGLVAYFTRIFLTRG